MTHLLDTVSDRLDVPDYPGLWVEFRRELSFADDLALEQRRQEISSRAPRNEVTGDRDPDAYLVAEFVVLKSVAMVTAWNLTDAEGAPLPVAPASFSVLRKPVIHFIADESARRLMGRPAEKEAPFVKRSRRYSRPAKA